MGTAHVCRVTPHPNPSSTSCFKNASCWSSGELRKKCGWGQSPAPSGSLRAHTLQPGPREPRLLTPVLTAARGGRRLFSSPFCRERTHFLNSSACIRKPSPSWHGVSSMPCPPKTGLGLCHGCSTWGTLPPGGGSHCRVGFP